MISISKTTTEEGRIASMLLVQSENVCLVGSQLICGNGKDNDFLVLIRDESKLKEAGFSLDVEDSGYPSEFASWRKGDDNVIATSDRGFFLAEYATAYAARTLSHLSRNDGKAPFDMDERNDRVAFHGIIREAVSMRLHAS